MAADQPSENRPTGDKEEDQPSAAPQAITRRAAVGRTAAGFLGATSAFSSSVVHGEAVMAWLLQDPAAWKPQVFSPHQNELTLAIVELIIPETDTPGARQARVNQYIDVVLTEADFKDAYLAGLEWLDQFAKLRRGAGFLDLNAGDRQATLAAISDEHDSSEPELAEGRSFFDLVKRLTVYGYYTSEPGLLEELRYQGGDFLNEFPAACTHEGH